LDFEVFILMGMVCDDSLKQATLERIDASWAGAKTTKKRIGGALRLTPTQFTNLQELLGIDPQGAEPEFLTYRPLLWPAFDIVVTSDRGYWGAARFIRREHLRVPIISEPEELATWSVTINELDDMFGPLEDGDHWPPYEEFLFNAASSARYGASFSWGLLQRLQKLPTPDGQGSSTDSTADNRPNI
jgi:hypothetical protein